MSIKNTINASQTVILLSTIVAVVALGIANEYQHLPETAVAYERTSPLKTVEQENIFFFSPTYQARNNTFVSIPFQYEGAPPIIWIGLETQDGTKPILRFMEHPLLANLDWPRVENQTYSLYQRSAEFDSVEAFLKNPPNATIYIDPFLYDLNTFPQLNAQSLEVNTDLSQADYILTTYHPLRVENNTRYFETTLDATNARVNDQGELIWYIQAPGVNPENPIQIGEIHVDYR